MNAEPRPADAPAEERVLAACPSCHGLVRIPRRRLAEDPRCPRCKAQVMTGRPFDVDARSFSTHVERAGVPVLVDFWAPWCGPCRMMAPVLDAAAARRGASMQLAKVNTDQQQELAARFGIRSIPTLILFRDGRVLARQSGALDPGSLERWLNETLGAS